MDKNGIAQRYAEAIYNVVKNKDKVKITKECLGMFFREYGKNKELRDFLNSPVIKLHEKNKIVEKIFDFGDEDISNIISYLIKKNRLEEMRNIEERFFEFCQKKEGKVLIKAIFPVELSEIQVEKLKEKLEKKYNKRVKLTLEVDESLIGGGILKVGDDIIDGSIKYQLLDIKKRKF